jgi:hypothetical protein
MQLDFAFICDHARILRTCQNDIHIDALSITRSLAIPSVPYIFNWFFVVAGARGAAAELCQEAEVRLVDPDGKDVIEPLHPGPVGGQLAAQATLVVPLVDVPFRKLGMHQVLLAVGGVELGRVSFEVAIVPDYY